MRRRTPTVGIALLFLAAAMLVGCGDGGGGGAATNTAPAEEAPPARTPIPEASIVARDFAFEVATPIPGGLVQLSYYNAGKEPHFAAFAKIAPGKTVADVRTAVLAPPTGAPPPGPPPFEEVAAFPTADPGISGRMTLNLPAGSYAFYCAIPSPDGTPHAAKGMVTEVTVSDGPEGALPASVGTVRAIDFGLAPVPPLKAGSNVVRITNEGKQLHEIGLVEVAAGRTMDNVVAWFRQQSGPPPLKFLAGAAIKPGSDATADLNLQPGRTYAFLCAIPDFLGDFAPHVTKGMYTSTFTVK
jgi:plastocyanin